MWDTDAVGEEDIAENVSKLLSIKMIGMPEVTQLALKIAACFGTTLDLMVITTLMSASPKFSSFRRELDNAVDEGFMDKDGSCSSYRFVHDKVRSWFFFFIEPLPKTNLSVVTRFEKLLVPFRMKQLISQTYGSKK